MSGDSARVYFQGCVLGIFLVGMAVMFYGGTRFDSRITKIGFVLCAVAIAMPLLLALFFYFCRENISRVNLPSTTSRLGESSEAERSQGPAALSPGLLVDRYELPSPPPYSEAVRAPAPQVLTLFLQPLLSLSPSPQPSPDPRDLPPSYNEAMGIGSSKT